MPRFNVTATFSLTSEIEPGYFNLGLEDAEGVSHFEDGSYWSRKAVESDGGQLTFQVEAEDENAVYDLVHENLREDMEVEDNDSWTWMVRDLKVEVEELEDEMTKGKAVEIVRTWLLSAGSLEIPSEVRKALLFLLDTVTFD